MSMSILADFLSLKKSLGQSVLIAVLCGAIIGLACGDVNIVPPMVMFMVAIGQCFSLVALDERNGWEAYRCTLPVSRSQIIAGRMVFTVIISIAFLILGVVIAAAICAVAPMAKGLDFLSAAAISLDATALAISCIGSIAALFILMGICFPVVAKFGMTRAVRVLPLVFVFVFLGIVVFAGGSDGALLSGIDAFLSAFPLAVTSAAIIVVSAAIYVAGGFAATRLYEQREF